MATLSMALPSILPSSREQLVQRVLMAALLLVCITSDAFLAQEEFMKDYKLFRHLVDSGAHGAVSFCCYGIFLCQCERGCLTARRTSSLLPMTTSTAAANSPNDNDNERDGAPTSSSITSQPWARFIGRCALAGVTASLLDVDHFIAAGSFSISGATHLKHRPFGHAVTFIVAVAATVWSCSSKRSPQVCRRRVCFVVIALLSHQLRDGMRLGLWFWPLGSTPPIEYILYLLLEEVLPFAMAWWQLRADGKTETQEFEAVAQHPDHDEADDGDAGAELRSITIHTSVPARE
ncbi:Transmembrane protein c5orf28, partial [Globisporangium splendens]